MASSSGARKQRANPITRTLIVVATIAVLALIAVAAFRFIPPLFAGEPDPTEPQGTTHELKLPDSTMRDATITIPKGWAAAANDETGDLDVRTPNDALRATVRAVPGTYDQVFDAYVAQHPTSSPTRWEWLASELKIVHADIDGCVFSVVQATPQTSVTVNACPTEGNELETYRVAVGELVEGVRP